MVVGWMRMVGWRGSVVGVGRSGVGRSQEVSGV